MMRSSNFCPLVLHQIVFLFLGFAPNCFNWEKFYWNVGGIFHVFCPTHKCIRTANFCVENEHFSVYYLVLKL